MVHAHDRISLSAEIQIIFGTVSEGPRKSEDWVKVGVKYCRGEEWVQERGKENLKERKKPQKYLSDGFFSSFFFQIIFLKYSIKSLNANENSSESYYNPKSILKRCF